MIESKYLTVKQLAKRWNVGERKIYTMKDNGEIAYTQIGGSIRFPLEKIEAYERTQTIEPETEEPKA